MLKNDRRKGIGINTIFGYLIGLKFEILSKLKQVNFGSLHRYYSLVSPVLYVIFSVSEVQSQHVQC